jgi:hypothetical protein
VQSVLVSLAVHSRSDSYYALAPVGLPEGPEFRIHGTTLKTGTLQLAANPFAIFFVDQSQKPVVTPFEGSGGKAEKHVHPVVQADRTGAQIPIPGSQLRAAQREIQSLQLAVGMRFIHETQKICATEKSLVAVKLP